MSTIPKITVLPNQQEVIECKLEKLHPSLQNVIGIIEPSLLFERKTGLCVMSSISRIDSTFRTKIVIINLQPYKITVSPQTRIGKFQLVTQKQASYLLPIHPSIIDCYKELNTVIETKQTSEMDNYTSKNFWFATPENCGDPSTLNGIQKTIYDTIKRFKQLELLDPTINQENKKQFLEKFNWSGSIFTKLERQKMEDLLVKHHQIFAPHRLDLGKNTDCLVKLTPEHDKPIYTSNTTKPIHLRDEILIELALMQYYDIITTLPFSKYSSPIFAQRKSSGKLRILIDLRRINHLLQHDYTNNNFPIPTMSDASAHLAGKKIFAKMDCSQAYFSMQMADEKSVQL